MLQYGIRVKYGHENLISIGFHLSGDLISVSLLKVNDFGYADPAQLLSRLFAQIQDHLISEPHDLESTESLV